MCSCQQHAPSSRATIPAADTLTFRVEDMTCGHCAGTIKGAIEAKLPGTTVTADPGSKQVSVQGASDYAAIKAIVAAAGYTASAEQAG